MCDRQMMEHLAAGPTGYVSLGQSHTCVTVTRTRTRSPLVCPRVTELPGPDPGAVRHALDTVLDMHGV